MSYTLPVLRLVRFDDEPVDIARICWYERGNANSTADPIRLNGRDLCAASDLPRFVPGRTERALMPTLILECAIALPVDASLHLARPAEVFDVFPLAFTKTLFRDKE